MESKGGLTSEEPLPSSRLHSLRFARRRPRAPNRLHEIRIIAQLSPPSLEPRECWKIEKGNEWIDIDSRDGDPGREDDEGRGEGEFSEVVDQSLISHGVEDEGAESCAR